MVKIFELPEENDSKGQGQEGQDKKNTEGTKERRSQGNQGQGEKPAKEQEEKHVLVRHRTLEEIFEDINKDKKEGKKKAAPSEIPRLMVRLLVFFTLVATVLSIITAITDKGSSLLYGLTFMLWSVSLYLAYVALFDPVVRPDEWIISFLGEFNDIATPGSYPYRIPGLTRVESKVKVDTSQPLELFREEKEKPVIFADGVKAKPKALVIINIKDPYAVTYKVAVHDNFVKERQKIGIFYDPSHKYFYAIEEILDSLIRGFFGGMGIEQVLQLKTAEYAEAQKAIKKDAIGGESFEIMPNIVKEIEKAADYALKPFGVDVESLAFPEIDILDTSIIEKLQEKFKAKQDEEITTLKEKVEMAQVKVEIQKALQREKQGIGEGSFFKKQIEPLKEQGLSSSQAAGVVTTKMWTDAAQKGAKVSIISTAEGGKVQMPIMTGVGMGIGQEIAEKKETKKTPKEESSKDKNKKQKKPSTEASSKKETIEEEEEYEEE